MASGAWQGSSRATALSLLENSSNVACTPYTPYNCPLGDVHGTPPHQAHQTMRNKYYPSRTEFGTGPCRMSAPSGATPIEPIDGELLKATNPQHTSQPTSTSSFSSLGSSQPPWSSSRRKRRRRLSIMLRVVHHKQPPPFFGHAGRCRAPETLGLGLSCVARMAPFLPSNFLRTQKQ